MLFGLIFFYLRLLDHHLVPRIELGIFAVIECLLLLLRFGFDPAERGKKVLEFRIYRVDVLYVTKKA